MTKPPFWFVIVAVAAILFELMGVASYLMDVTRSPEALAALPINQQLMWAAMPKWLTGAYAIAVFAGLAGAIGLLLKRTWSIPLLGLSLLAAIVQFGGIYASPRLRNLMDPGQMVVPLAIILICAAIYAFAHRAHHRGWLQ